MAYLRITARLLSTATTALLAAGVSLSAHAQQQNDDILGRWRITKVLDSSDIAALTDNQAARLVGKIFIVEPNKVSLGNEVCKEPDFNRHYEDTVRYLREEAHASSWKLGLPEVVTVVDLSCTEVLLNGYNKVVLYWRGFFFDAVKQD
jgi:hypothetical protein